MFELPANTREMQNHHDGFKQGAETFIHKGTNRRWRDVPTEADNRKHEQTIARNLSADCARWLVSGERPEVG